MRRSPGPAPGFSFSVATFCQRDDWVSLTPSCLRVLAVSSGPFSLTAPEPLPFVLPLSWPRAPFAFSGCLEQLDALSACEGVTTSASGRTRACRCRGRRGSRSHRATIADFRPQAPSPAASPRAAARCHRSLIPRRSRGAGPGGFSRYHSRQRRANRRAQPPLRFLMTG
jgi:hypothetical protein